MVHYEVSFKLSHECPYLDLSKKYPSVVMSHWCNNDRDVLELSYHDLDSFQELQEDMEKLSETLGVRILRRAFSKSNVQLVTQHCGCNHFQSTTPTIEKNNCLELQPTIYRDGWEWYRVIAFSEKDLRALFQDLDKFCEVEVLSKSKVEDSSVRDTFVVSTANLLGELTDKQLEALVLALDNGYYRVPKKVTTEEIANKLKLPRTTFEEHLRKAESKVLRAVEPYIQLRPVGKARR